MWISSCITVFVVAVVCENSFLVKADISTNRNSEGYVDFPFYGSLPLNYDLLPSFGQKRRPSLEAVRNAIGHSLRVRKSQQSMRDNSFSHALRVRRGRQWDAMGHTLRIKRDVSRSFGHALRVRRGDENENKFDEENFQFNDNQELVPDNLNWSDADKLSLEGRPRRFLAADRRASDGIRLHTLRVKKANEDLWNDFFTQAQEQAAARPATLIGSTANWAKRKATLNHVLRVRKDQVSPSTGREEENTDVIYYY